jgi:hypothetical protein
VAITSDQRLPDRWCDQPGGAADVENLTGRTEHGGNDLGVAAEAAYGAGRDLGAVLGDPHAQPGAQVGVVHQDREPRRGAVLVWQQVCGLAAAAGLDQRVEQPGAVVSWIAPVVERLNQPPPTHSGVR